MIFRLAVYRMAPTKQRIFGLADIHMATHGYKFLLTLTSHVLSPPLLVEVQVIIDDCYKLKEAHYLKFKLQI